MKICYMIDEKLQNGIKMKKPVKKSILDIKNNFDVFIFDVYGVIWNGREIYTDVPKVMKHLKQENKIIYILSNSTMLSSSFEKNYEAKGLKKGIHYDKVITSGEVARDFLLNKKLKFKNNSNPINFYTVGLKNKSLFENTIYNSVDNPRDADFFYFGIPQLTEDQTKDVPSKLRDKFFLSKIRDNGEKQYSITTPDFFKNELLKVKKFHLSGFNANPDIGSFKNDVLNKSTRYGLAQGAISEYYKNMGGKVLEIGKPYGIVYDYIFDLLKKDNVKINKKRIAMIGDTIRTDIRGGNLAGIQTVLTTNTGITASKITKNNSINFDELNKIFVCENGYADWLIQSVAPQQIQTNLLLTLTKNERN